MTRVPFIPTVGPIWRDPNEWLWDVICRPKRPDRLIGTCPSCGLLLGYANSDLVFAVDCPGCLQSVKFRPGHAPTVVYQFPGWREYLVATWRRIA